jgi:putative membrane protein
VEGPAEALFAASLAIFVVLHGLTLYRWVGVMGFIGITAMVAFGFEACSVATGFPFGHYVHHLGGPRALGVPFEVVAGWVVLGWLAWALARGIVGQFQNRRLCLIATPLVAALVIGGYDLVMDPIAAYVRGLFSYAVPSGALGVPVSNFFGWLFTGWVIFQCFALIERRWRRESHRVSRSVLLMPSLIWSVLALQVTINMLRAGDASVAIRSGMVLQVSDIYESSAEAAWFTMVFAAVVSMVRILADTSRANPLAQNVGRLRRPPADRVVDAANDDDEIPTSPA